MVRAKKIVRTKLESVAMSTVRVEDTVMLVACDSDINDTYVGVTTCEQLCINEEGPSYHCACSEGYTLKNDSHVQVLL